MSASLLLAAAVAASSPACAGVPDVLGSAKTRQDWTGGRRAEVQRVLEDGLYGRRPVERPADLAFAVTSVEDVYGGKAVKKLVRATCSGPGGTMALDWLETEPLVDARHVAVCGLSRNGKAALVAGSTDARFALAVSCCSGEGGAKLRHADCPGSETVRDISIAWRWFAPSYVQWTDRDREMPFDQHWLLALMAPRLCYVSSATDDAWAGPNGEYASAELASEVWRLFGQRGLVSDGFPHPDTPRHEGSIGYHLRTGDHALTPYDWEQYLNFTDRHGWTAR